jgi:hypothetical protein
MRPWQETVNMLALPSTRRSTTAAVLALGLFAAACSKSTGGGGGGGPVSGTTDDHCAGVPAQPTSQNDCHLTAPADAGPVPVDAGSDYGPTMFDSEGDDDDCKYHVKWTSSAISENSNVTFTVVATNKTDGTPLTGPGPTTGVGAGADVYIEAYLDDTHPAPLTQQSSDETTPGTYAIGPIQFDASGKWTVRYHFYEDCSDIAADSPHGHAAFYVDVP